MTADPIDTWLGPDNGHVVSVDDNPKASGDSRRDDPSRDPLGTVRLFAGPPRDDSGLAIRWRGPADTIEQYPWLLLGSDGPQKLSNETLQGYPRVGLGFRSAVDAPPIRLQALRIPGDRYILVFSPVTDPALFEGVDMARLRDHLGAAAVLALEFPVEVL